MVEQMLSTLVGRNIQRVALKYPGNQSIEHMMYVISTEVKELDEAIASHDRSYEDIVHELVDVITACCRMILMSTELTNQVKREALSNA